MSGEPPDKCPPDPPPVPRRVRGIVCPRCGGPLTLTHTRRPVRGLIVRYRSCIVTTCGVRVVTEERIRLQGDSRE